MIFIIMNLHSLLLSITVFSFSIGTFLSSLLKAFFSWNCVNLFNRNFKTEIGNCRSVGQLSIWHMTCQLLQQQIKGAWSFPILQLSRKDII